MSKFCPDVLTRASLTCTAVSLAARGAGWEDIGRLLGPKLPGGMTMEQLRAEALAHLEKERTA